MHVHLFEVFHGKDLGHYQLRRCNGRAGDQLRRYRPLQGSERQRRKSRLHFCAIGCASNHPACHFVDQRTTITAHSAVVVVPFRQELLVTTKAVETETEGANQMNHSRLRNLFLFCVAGISLFASGRNALSQSESPDLDSAFNVFDSVRVNLHTEELWKSPLTAEPETFVTDAKVIHQGKTWGTEIVRPVHGRLGFDSHLNIVYRNRSAITVNSFTDNAVPVLSGSGFSAILLSEKISGQSKRFDEMWPTDGNVELPCFGILFGKSVYSPKGYLPNPTIQVISGNRLLIKSDSEFGNIEIDADSTTRLPLKIILSQNPEHFHHGKRIRDWDTTGSSTWPAGKVSSVRTAITMTIATQTPPSAITTYKGWRTERDITFESKAVYREEADTTVSFFDVGGTIRPNDYWFDLKIPDMCRIQVDGASHLSYVWDGDWASPKADILAHANRYSPSHHLWLILALNVVGLSIFGSWWYRKNRKPVTN